MAEQLGGAVLTLSVDDSQLKAGLKAAEQQAKSAGQSIEQAFTKTGKPLQAPKGVGAIGDGLAGAAGDVAGLTAGFGGLAGGAAAAAASVLAIGAAVVGVGAAATQAAGQTQRLTAAFVGLTGSAEAAKQLRQDLFTLSKTTPFKNEDILQAAQRFLAVGVEVDKLQGTINRVGAIAAQSGQPLERLALIYAQVYAKGRLQGEENLQLLEAGVDLTQELSQVTGLSGKALQDAMSKGQIGIDDFNKALILATGDMKSLQLAGQAVDVQFNNIGDNIGQVFGGFAQAIAPALSAAFKVINDIFDQAFPSLESITQFFAPLTEGAKQFAAALSGNPELVAALAASFRSLGEVIIGNIGRGLQFISDLLAKIDGKALVNGLLTVEVVLRKSLLLARALSLTLVKNAELTYRAVSNPVQFGVDIARAGGFGAFMAQQYKEATDAWNAATSAKPLPFPDVKPGGKQAMEGDLSNKAQFGNTDQARLDAQLKYVAASQQAYDEAVALQGLQGAALQVAQQQLKIDRLRAAERKAIAEYDKALVAAGFDRNNPGVIEAEARLKAAGLDIKTALIDGGNALIDAAKQAREQLLSATLNRAQQLGTRDQGLNKFLASSTVDSRVVQAAKALKAPLEEALKSIRTRFGTTDVLSQNTLDRIAAFRQGSTTDIDFIRDFITANNEDINGQQALIEANKNNTAITEALNTTGAQLATIIPPLAEQLLNLAKKDWVVNVNVPGGSASGNVVGAVNGGF